MAPIIIDNVSKLQLMLSQIPVNDKDENQVLFLDLEGINLGRSGTIAIMQLMIPKSSIVCLIDVFTLGSATFETSTEDGVNLKKILESGTIFKVFFDVRNDSDALHAHFGIKLAGVIDLQLIEFATRSHGGRFLSGLAKCISMDLPYDSKRSAIKEKGRRLFAPEVGGRYEVFEQRPMSEDIVKYCEQDVLLMPQLLSRYSPKLVTGVAAQLQAITDERVRWSQSVSYNGKGRHMAIPPTLLPAG